jgi:hypothetical protein
LGHALHFLLSATAAGAAAGDCGCWAGIDLCEVTSHVTERMARDARCLQVSCGRSFLWRMSLGTALTCVK